MGELATSLPPSTKRPSLVECTMESTTKVQEEEQEIIEQEKEAQTFLLILLVIHVVFLLPLHMYRYVLEVMEILPRSDGNEGDSG